MGSLLTGKPFTNSRARMTVLVVMAGLLLPATAYAGHGSSETMDMVASVLAWVVLIVAPVIGIAVFLLIHIIPEKVAEKRHHPQLDAIKTLCLLSLFFGGMLWPLAWLWAYSKPVMYKLAYGTDKVVHGEEAQATLPESATGETEELRQLRQRLADLENRMAGWPSAQRGS